MAILRDMSESLKDILKRKISEISDENAITFDSPADIEPAANPRLSIFLYQVIENSFLRNEGSQPVGIDKMRPPPLTLDLYYLFTPYAKNRDDELIILERIMQIFHDNPVFKGEILKDSLKDRGNTEIRAVPNNLTFEEINKLWERFPNKVFKLSISYILTPVRIPSEPSEEKLIPITRVLEKDIAMYRLGVHK